MSARTARWGEREREAAREILDRIASESRARRLREVRTRFAAADAAMVDEAISRFGAIAPFGGPTSSGMLTLHCPPARVFALARFLREKGAQGVSVAELDYVFASDNPLYEALERAL